MEPSIEKNQECSIKIDTIWSEADESLLIKEEIVSDLEPDCTAFAQDNSSSCFENQSDTQAEDDSSCNGYSDIASVPTWQPLKKKIKSKSQKSEESEMIVNHKLSCLHDTKNFRIIKKRLRCGDCRSLVCPECCKVMIPNLQSHFLGSGVCGSGAYLCKLCSIIFHSLCALQAHIRIHTMDTPYVCPDCGLMYNNIYFLILHLLNKCYHVYKIVRYKCKQCPGACFTPESFVQHIQEQHIHCVFRCLYCSSLFSNYDEFNYHMKNLHQKQKIQYLNYFRCSLCSNMVIPRFMYQRHIAQHRENSEFYEVDYQCLCGETYNLIGAFRSHFSYCNKKGIFPPKWSFLQKKLRTHDVVHHEKFQNKEVAFQSIPEHSNNDADHKKISLIKSDDKSKKSDEEDIGNEEIEKKINCVVSAEASVRKTNSDIVGHNSTIKEIENLNEEASNCKNSSNHNSNSNNNNNSNGNINNSNNNNNNNNNNNYYYSNNNSNNNNNNNNNNSSNNNNNDDDDDNDNNNNNSNSSNNNNNNNDDDDDDDNNNNNNHNNNCINNNNDDDNNRKNLFNFNSSVEMSDEIQSEKTLLGNFEKSETNRSKVNRATEFQLKDSSKELANESVLVESNKCSEERNKSGKNNKEPEQADSGKPNFYDHIPCDHLGYLIKTQCIEPPKKPCQEEDVIIEKCFSPKSYKIITVLDEKTGIITTKTVSLNELNIEDEEEENTNVDDLENIQLNTTVKNYCNDKTKFKVNSSLSCPFCIVLFPKHNLTFQQFRLHLESYHPDAALNIIVNKDEDKIPNKIFIEKSGDTEKGNISNDYKDLKSSADNSSKITSSDKQILNLDNVEKDLNSKENQNDIDQDPVSEDYANELKKNSETTADAVSKQTSFHENEVKNLPESKRLKILHKSACHTEKPLTNSEYGKIQSWELVDCRVETVSTQVEINCSNKEFSLEKNETTEKNKVSIDKNDEEKTNTIGEKSNDNYLESFDENVERNKKEKKLEELSESEDKILPRTVSDLEYEGETSKDSNWSGVSDKDSKNISSVESKAEEKERSRRESEVWSEFYESLMLAEKLKKRKNSSLESEGKKKSVVSDYSSKRIVKKPKRYRESSESADSNELYESEDEFLIENDFMEKVYSEERGEADDQLSKRQILLNKLENVDSKLVNYLFDMVTKKEKLFELYKKHSTLRANRYSHDLRSYRKKVLNGIKQRGRPLKILRYHELLRREEPGEDKNSKELKKKSEFSPESKINERKRGRPRKCHDPAKLKERRRSDKEVDFIEKNFEREESELSPSKRKRKLSSKLQYYRKMSEEKDDFSSGQVITNKPADSSKKFTCAVCKDVFPELSEFRDHVIVHRMEENTYQCMECGECFVVKPSLEKHLHAFHKIKNTDKYITDNQCCNIKKEAVEVDNEPLKENQCKVCKDQFDKASDLTKHFRIHGMAFLKEFRREGKSNEKRNT